MFVANICPPAICPTVAFKSAPRQCNSRMVGYSSITCRLTSPHRFESEDTGKVRVARYPGEISYTTWFSLLQAPLASVAPKAGTTHDVATLTFFERGNL